MNILGVYAYIESVYWMLTEYQEADCDLESLVNTNTSLVYWWWCSGHINEIW